MKNSLVVLALMALTATGCASHKLQAWNGREQAKPASRKVSADSRLVVQIGNVSDRENRRNETELFVNGKKITPHETDRVQQRDNIYELSLPSGVHKVHAVYRAKSFWKDLEFKLTTHDGHVRLYPDYTTFLTITLEKKSDGALLRSKNLFTETPRAMKKTVAPQVTQAATIPTAVVEAKPPVAISPIEELKPMPAERPIIVKAVNPPSQTAPKSAEPEASEPAQEVQQPRVAPMLPQVSLDRRASEAEHSTSATPAAISAPKSTVPTVVQVETETAAIGTIKLQINTTPANADVIVDDKYLGQSPLVTHVERGRSHVIQISRKGYVEKIKLLDRNEFVGQQTYFLIEKLEKDE